MDQEQEESSKVPEGLGDKLAVPEPDVLYVDAPLLLRAADAQRS